MFGPMPLSQVSLPRRAVTLLAAAAVHLLVIAGAARLTVAAPAPVTVLSPDTAIIYVDSDIPGEGEQEGGTGADLPGLLPSLVDAPDAPALPVESGLVDFPRPGLPDPRRFAAGTGSAVSDRTGSAIPGAVDVDEPPALVRPGQADYPPALEAAGVSGSVRVRFVVDSTGWVRDGSVEVLSATHPVFADAARRAVAGSRFRPGRHGGRAVAVLVEQVVSFRSGDPD
jgi:protein TonB